MPKSRKAIQMNPKITLAGSYVTISVCIIGSVLNNPILVQHMQTLQYLDDITTRLKKAQDILKENNS